MQDNIYLTLWQLNALHFGRSRTGLQTQSSSLTYTQKHRKREEASALKMHTKLVRCHADAQCIPPNCYLLNLTSSKLIRWNTLLYAITEVFYCSECLCACTTKRDQTVRTTHPVCEIQLIYLTGKNLNIHEGSPSESQMY